MTSPPSRNKGPLEQEEPPRGVTTWQVTPHTPLQVLLDFVGDMTSHFSAYWPLEDVVRKLNLAAADDDVRGDMRVRLLALGAELGASPRPCVTAEMIGKILAAVA